MYYLRNRGHGRYLTENYCHKIDYNFRSSHQDTPLYPHDFEWYLSHMDLKIFMELFKVPIWLSGLLIILPTLAIDILPINQLKQWIVELWRWITEGKIIFICLLVIAAAVIFG